MLRDSDTSFTAAPDARRTGLLHGHARAYGIALVVCAIIALVDYGVLNSLHSLRSWRWLAEYALCALFVFQVVVLACATGKALRHAPARWLFFVWCLVLINLLLQTLEATSVPLRFAFLSAQFALLCIWCFLGQTPWPWRVAIGVVLFPLLASWTFASSFGSGWPLIVLLQCVAVLAVSSFGRWLGYRVRRVEIQAGSSSKTSIQFRIRDMMVWMVAIGPAMLILKSMSWLRMLDFIDWSEFATAVVISATFTATTILSLRATLGKTAPIRALAIVVILPGIIGYMLWFGFDLRATQLGSWGGGGRQLVTGLAIWIGWRWVPWMILMNSFLAGLLLCFRADGQQLVRVHSRSNANQHR